MAFPLIFSLLIIPFSISPLTTALPTLNATAACSTLSSKYPHQVATNGLTLNTTLNSEYHEATTRYWSGENADNVPTCVFFPTTAEQVASAVQVLNVYTNVPWAVKGGGHNPNKGFSSTDGGILIAMQENAGVSYDEEAQVAHIGAGARWGDIQIALDPYGVAVVGGRLGDVGIAGYTLGGGLSFLSTEYGFTADTVKNFQVVTAAGAIENANQTSNTDLFYAMKGGGNQFAIVVTYTLQTYSIDRVWGGHRIYNLTSKPALLAATHNLVSDYHDPKAAVIVTFSSTLLDLVNIFVVFYFYNSPAGPGPILDEFLSIPCIQDSVLPDREFGELLVNNSQFSIDGMRYLIRTGTLPNLPGANGTDLYEYTFDSWFSRAEPYTFSAVDNYVLSFAFQPVPHQLVQASQDSPNGGNTLGLDSVTGDHVFVEYDVSWLLPTTDEIAAELIPQLTQPVQDYAREKYASTEPTNYQSGEVEWTNFNPLFMNDGMYNQDPLRSYGSETYNRLSQIQKARDPNGFFSQRTGGFKLT